MMMRSSIGFFILSQLLILSQLSRADDLTVKIDEDEQILALASNGQLLAVALPSKIRFFSMISNSSQTLLADLFTIEFDNKLSTDQTFDFDFVSENRFVFCSIDNCRLYKINPDEKSARLLLADNTGFELKSWTSVVLNDKLLFNFLPKTKNNSVIYSYDLSDGHRIAKVNDHVTISQHGKIHSFKRGLFTYFISTITEPDLYSDTIRGVKNQVVTRTRLSRVCNDDNSNDLVTKINIHLACGSKINDYPQIPVFEYQSSFLTNDDSKLFILFGTKETGYLSCSYSMEEIEQYFGKVWDSCQQIENRATFTDLCMGEEDPSFCTFTWMGNNGVYNCERFGRGSNRNKKYLNCQASTYNHSLGRNGHLENYLPLWGRIEEKYSENQQFETLDENTFMAFSESKQLRRLSIASQHDFPLWNQTVDKFATVPSRSDHPSYIIYSKNNEIIAQQITCAALYSNCASINWKDPLQCSYCAFSNSTGYVTDINGKNNQTCIKSEGKVVVNQCPPTIQNVKITNGDVTIVGDSLKSFDNLKVFVCEEECEIKQVLNNVIECRREDEVLNGCDVRIVGDLVNTPAYSVVFPSQLNENYGDNEDDTTTPGKSAGRTTKFVVGIVAAVFLLAAIILVGYLITCKQCNNNPPLPTSKGFPHTEFINGQPGTNVELYGLVAFPDVDKIERIKTIGRGNFATVYKYVYKTPPHKELAVKELIDGDKREVELIEQCKHPNIVEYFGYFRHEGNVCLVMEYLGGGELHKFLINTENHFSWGEGFDFILQIADGMCYLAKNQIIHRDLAARNILMSADHKIVKINDFGLGRKTNLGDMYQIIDTRTKLPFRWTALECLLGHPFTEKSDVWSFGITMWEIFSRARIPYNGYKNNADIENLLQRGERLPQPDCPEQLYELMVSCWRDDPDERPTFNELYNQITELVNDLSGDTTTDYYSIYLTPRVSMNEGHQSAPTIMEDSDVSNFVSEKSNSNDQSIMNSV